MDFRRNLRMRWEVITNTLDIEIETEGVCVSEYLWKATFGT